VCSAVLWHDRSINAPHIITYGNLITVLKIYTYQVVIMTLEYKTNYCAVHMATFDP